MDTFQKAKDHFLAGIQKLESGALEEAEREFLASLDLAPGRPSTLTNLGATQIKLKKFSAAKSTCKEALASDKNNSEALLNLGLAYKETGDLITALDSFKQALMLDPKSSKAWSNKGSALRDLHRYEEALISFDRALDLDEKYYEAWTNRGLTLNDLGRHNESIQSYAEAISINRNYVDAWFNKGSIYLALKEFSQALACFETAFEINPDYEYLLGDLVHSKLLIGDWKDLDEKLLRLVKQIEYQEPVSTPFPMLSAVDKPELHLATAKLWANKQYPRNTSLPVIPKKNHSKIRIGYFSPDFKDHPVSFLMAELFELHHRDEFEIFAFSLKADNAGGVVRKRLIAGFDQFLDVENKSDQEVTQLSRDNEIDIAIDLSGYTQFSRTGIFAHRAAPIQVNYLGYPGTLGTGYFDYIIADPTLIPPTHQCFYAEKVAYLPYSYMVDDSKRIASEKILEKKDFGLPDNTFVFCCFNNSYKFNAELITSWAKIMLKVPNSVLWLSENNKDFKSNLLIAFSSRGVDPTRLIFAPRVELMEDHLARYRMADLFLDTLPFNAHTTALDALKAGVPILALTGEAFAGRVTTSLLKAINLPDLITNSREEYESLAVELVKTPNKLDEIKKRLQINLVESPLFNTQIFVKNIETLYKKMYEQYQEGLAPEHLTI
ncbi:tetratricopeptide repeat protein [Polynucleobacter sp. MWH-Creno-3A4]|uniref:tetratricopeptide repeat protein n=1 Tax=Polynucleobacter sp. MWH-Creno-3A4 TaxID=1855886 RepID=UPI001C0C65BC|nr:tetratricopeptide repeat protein [Polynucleobacter sp. MWH-Creno-3A4]